jgi:WD40 repeat protein
MCFSPDGKVLAVGGGRGSTPGVDELTGEIRFWDAQLGQRLLNMPELHFDVNSMSWSPDGKFLAVSNGNSKKMTLWDVSQITARQGPLGKP